jgi:hypothetical protein
MMVPRFLFTGTEEAAAVAVAVATSRRGASVCLQEAVVAC